MKYRINDNVSFRRSRCRSLASDSLIKVVLATIHPSDVLAPQAQNKGERLPVVVALRMSRSTAAVSTQFPSVVYPLTYDQFFAAVTPRYLILEGQVISKMWLALLRPSGRLTDASSKDHTADI